MFLLFPYTLILPLKVVFVKSFREKYFRKPRSCHLLSGRIRPPLVDEHDLLRNLVGVLAQVFDLAEFRLLPALNRGSHELDSGDNVVIIENQRTHHAVPVVDEDAVLHSLHLDLAVIPAIHAGHDALHNAQCDVFRLAGGSCPRYSGDHARPAQ